MEQCTFKMGWSYLQLSNHEFYLVSSGYFGRYVTRRRPAVHDTSFPPWSHAQVGLYALACVAYVYTDCENYQHTFASFSLTIGEHRIKFCFPPHTHPVYM